MNAFAKVLMILLMTAGAPAATRAEDNPSPGIPRGTHGTGPAPGLTLIPFEPGEEWEFPQESRDPGYALYRDGYRLILDEQWGEARKKFGELIRRYPHSSYLDDARFWSAYSWKFSDRKKALEEYARFIKDFPSSNYLDDAVSEYQRLGGKAGSIVRDVPQGVPEAAFRIAELEKKLAQIQERLIIRVPQPPQISFAPRREEPGIRVKAEALRALTRTPEDEKAFTVLKETALDTTQPMDIRMVALDGARRFRIGGVGTFLLDVVRNSQDLRFRMMAMEGLRITPAPENQAIFGSLRSLALDQSEPADLRMSALQVLERGDREQFPKVLSQIAKSDRQLRLQISALQYLSRQQAGERREAANVLQEVAMDRNRDPAVREVALFGLRQLSTASGLLIETAKTDPQERVRLAAVYSLGSSFGENPEVINQALEGLAADRTQPRLVRQTALSQLGERGKAFDADFLATLASGEPDEDIQQMAIHVLGKVAQGRAKSFAVLTSLFRSIPDDRLGSKDVLLFSVASIGNNEAVDFLASVARSDASAPLRERAVYYLGNIGTEKARNALLEILRHP